MRETMVWDLPVPGGWRGRESQRRVALTAFYRPSSDKKHEEKEERQKARKARHTP